jgi:hypothetical protein
MEILLSLRYTAGGHLARIAWRRSLSSEHVADLLPFFFHRKKTAISDDAVEKVRGLWKPDGLLAGFPRVLLSLSLSLCGGHQIILSSTTPHAWKFFSQSLPLLRYTY